MQLGATHVLTCCLEQTACRPHPGKEVLFINILKDIKPVEQILTTQGNWVKIITVTTLFLIVYSQVCNLSRNAVYLKSENLHPDNSILRK